MPDNDNDKYSPAWYEGTRQQFLATPRDAISNQLAGRAADESLEIESAQRDELIKKHGYQAMDYHE